jgi:acyl-coenzyme A synthetase/AMP-(fatty) acid ligase
MISEETSCTECGPARIVTISDANIDLDTIEDILRNHESVREATVDAVDDGRGGFLLIATVTPDPEHSPSNELKLDLAWHVGAESGQYSIFKDIAFNDISDTVSPIREQEERTGLIHIAGHEVNTADVERSLMAYPGVVYARVIGVPDARKGEVLKAYVTLKDGIPRTNDMKSELAWQASVDVGPMIIFRDIEFGIFQPENAPIGTEDLPSPDGMVIVDEINEDGEVVRISSHRISTTEITSSLLSHPYIEDAAVVTVPDNKRGETMKAFVKLKEGVAPSNDLKLELAWHVMTDLKPISVFKNIDIGTDVPPPVEGESKPSEASAVETMVAQELDELLTKTGEIGDRVEHILSKHEAVSEAIVITVQDKVHGHALQAFVTLNEGYHATEDLMEELAWTSRTEVGEDIVFKSIKFRRFFPVTPSRAALVTLLKADAMEVPAMMSITIAD